MTITFKEDGSYEFSVWGIRGGGRDGQTRPGTVRVNNGRLQWQSRNGLSTATLYENKKGKRKLKGQREDGSNWEVTKTKK